MVVKRLKAIILQISAQHEENRNRQHQQMKEQRLKEFQDGVRERVRLIDKAKKQNQLEKSYKAVCIFLCYFIRSALTMCWRLIVLKLVLSNSCY